MSVLATAESKKRKRNNEARSVDVWIGPESITRTPNATTVIDAASMPCRQLYFLWTHWLTQTQGKHLIIIGPETELLFFLLGKVILLDSSGAVVKIAVPASDEACG